MLCYIIAKTVRKESTLAERTFCTIRTVTGRTAGTRSRSCNDDQRSNLVTVPQFKNAVRRHLLPDGVFLYALTSGTLGAQKSRRLCPSPLPDLKHRKEADA